jgi:hypothetical protein
MAASVFLAGRFRYAQAVASSAEFIVASCSIMLSRRLADGCVNTSGRNYEMSELRRYLLALAPLRAMWLIGSKLKHTLIFSKRKHTKLDLRYFLAFPPLIAMSLIRSKLRLSKSRSGELVEFQVSDCVCPTLRAGTQDIDIFELTFLLRDCDAKLQTQPRFIIDAGAHIGCAALFFASSFPRANIAAIEPDPSNSCGTRGGISAFALFMRPCGIGQNLSSAQTSRMTLAPSKSNLRMANAPRFKG